MTRKTTFNKVTILRSLAIIASIVGFITSFILLFEYHSAVTNPHHIAPCDISESISCTRLAQSGYSAIGGIPVAWFGVVAFFVTLIVTVVSFYIELGSVLFLISFCGTVGSVLLLLISKFIVGVLCPFCCIVYALWFLLAILTRLMIQNLSFVASFKSGLFEVVSFLKFFGRTLVQGPRGHFSSYISLLSVVATVFVGVAAGLLPIVVDFRLNSSEVDGRSERNISDAVKEYFVGMVEQWNSAPIEDFETWLSEDSQNFRQGPNEALVKIVEFADFECGACQLIYPKLERVLKKNLGKVRYSLHHFPLDNNCNEFIKRPMHLNACRLAELARCVGNQGKYWEGVDLIYKLGAQLVSRRIRADSAYLVGATSTLGLDNASLLSCLDGGGEMVAVKRDISNGAKLGLNSTPTFWINGKQVPRPTIDIIEAIIESILEKKVQ